MEAYLYMHAYDLRCVLPYLLKKKQFIFRRVGYRSIIEGIIREAIEIRLDARARLSKKEENIFFRLLKLTASRVKQ